MSYLSANLGNPGQFEATQAALHDFVDAADGTLSPFNFMGGPPSNPFADKLEERLDAFKTLLVDPVVGTSNPTITDAADNLFLQGGVVLNKTGPYMGVTTVQTQTYTQQSHLFGLIKNNVWIDNAPVNSTVLKGPLAGGWYIGPKPAAKDATDYLKTQLKGIGYLH